MVTVYGIRNCNTVKKALAFLDSNGIEYTFHDYKKSGIGKQKLRAWAGQTGYENLINRKGTTWRLLDDATKSSVSDQQKVLELLTEKTSLIKRPLVEKDGEIIALGFDEKEYGKAFVMQDS
ncbi:ArsC family reductase [Haoranjiania flava]|uniref:ArsC family reductase n=1 Tax=Haoranjiania flava TaxID=1856322 RepID=A0AAE3IMR7_9BACT|nr:ArsC family reductase [Haoranjiania flava]MCU7694930.1 ArsC family reductase [Haoranjiania flava]